MTSRDVRRVVHDRRPCWSASPFGLTKAALAEMQRAIPARRLEKIHNLFTVPATLTQRPQNLYSYRGVVRNARIRLLL